MEITTLLEYSDRSQLRAWLKENHFRKNLPEGGRMKILTNFEG